MPIPYPLCSKDIDYRSSVCVCSYAVVQAPVPRFADLRLTFVYQHLYLVQKLVVATAGFLGGPLQVLFHLASVPQYTLLVLLKNYTLTLLRGIRNRFVLFLLIHPILLLELELFARIVLHYFVFLSLAVLCLPLLLSRPLLADTLLLKYFLLLFFPFFLYHMLLLVIDESILVVNLVWVGRCRLNTGFCWFLLFV